ncbi:MAG: esterase-like activity of phytase family protein [Bacteroidaceae bacterium]|nr:esterase-like activity of phytase family protein [Bacteroidaceae bacterium]
MFFARTYRLRHWHVAPGNYSGITSLDDVHYAVVSDKDSLAGFHVWAIHIDSRTGRITSFQDEGFCGTPYPIRRDAEGVAFCPDRHSVFICGEADQRILEHCLDGTLTGRELDVPEILGQPHIFPNRGFEALCYDSLHQLFWTCTESPLPTDSARTLRLISFGSDMQPMASFRYILDPEQAQDHGRDHYHGVVAMTPLRDGSLLVLEREARIAPHYSGSRCYNRLFHFVPTTGEKQLLDSWQTRFTLLNTRFANYEGMCLGPRLNDGRQAVLLISDSQGAYSRGPWRLKDYIQIRFLNDKDYSISK